jgi:hypothetical protein
MKLNLFLVRTQKEMKSMSFGRKANPLKSDRTLV